MYSSLEISNFRGFSSLRLENLERVNLITGLNNVGKTSLLESIFLLSSNSPDAMLKIRALRGLFSLQISGGRGPETLWSSMFFQYGVDNVIHLNGQGTNPNANRTVEISVVADTNPKNLEQIIGAGTNPSRLGLLVTSGMLQTLKFDIKSPQYEGTHYLTFESTQPNFDQIKVGVEPLPSHPPFISVFQAARAGFQWEDSAVLYSELDVRGKQNTLLEVLQILEPNLKRLSLIFEGGVPILHGELHRLNRLLPLSDMGEGIGQLTNILLSIFAAAGGVVLLDEIGAGIHYSVLPRVWNVIGTTAEEYGTQIIATTHSRECVVAAHEGFSQTERYDLGLYRLYRNGKGEIAVADYDQENLEYAVEAGLEVR